VALLCGGDSDRSQLAEALLRGWAGSRVEVASAGTESAGVHSLTVEAPAEIAIDSGGAVSEHLDRYPGERGHFMITVCDSAAEVCPTCAGAATGLHWSFPDPAEEGGGREQQRAAFRRARDAISEHVEVFVEDVVGGPAAGGGVRADDRVR